MPALCPRVPSYRHHKPSGQAVVTIAGRDIYFGRHNSPESRLEYEQLVAELLLARRKQVRSFQSQSASDITDNELLERYLEHARQYYLTNGEPTSEPTNIGLALRPLRKLFVHTPAAELGPLRLKHVWEQIVHADLCRNEVNKRVRHILRAFKWAVGEELIPSSIHEALKAVSELRQGRSEARESPPVRHAPESAVEAVEPYVSRQVWAMIQLQRLTAMRPAEVCTMRWKDVETSGEVWIFIPESHKTQHLGRVRRVFLGPGVQLILRG